MKSIWKIKRMIQAEIIMFGIMLCLLSCGFFPVPELEETPPPAATPTPSQTSPPVPTQLHWTGERKIIPGDPMPLNRFGYSVSISGNTLIASSPFDTPVFMEEGSVYIFARDGETWTEQQKIVAGDANMFDNFGIAVSVSGDYAVIGAYCDGDGIDEGAAYIYKKNGELWEPEQKIVPAELDSGDEFGSHVQIAGDYAVIGSHNDDDTAQDAGAVYIYYNNGTTWIEQQKLTPGDGEPADGFGCCVSLSGNHVIAGAHGVDDNGSDAGSAYIYSWNGASWIEVRKLTPENGQAGDLFGTSVSLSGNYALIGAPGDSHDADDAGSAYIFYHDGLEWEEQQKLIPADRTAFDRFGTTVSLSGDFAIIGSPDKDGDQAHCGALYIFHRDGDSWIEQKKLTASDAGEGDYFGLSVNIADASLVVGACYDSDNGDAAGSVYAYDY